MYFKNWLRQNKSLKYLFWKTIKFKNSIYIYTHSVLYIKNLIRPTDTNLYIDHTYGLLKLEIHMKDPSKDCVQCTIIGMCPYPLLGCVLNSLSNCYGRFHWIKYGQSFDFLLDLERVAANTAHYLILTIF